MAKIEKAKGRKGDIKTSGYYRVFHHEKITKLLSKSQSAVITAGTELEKACYEVMDLDTNILTFNDPKLASCWIDTLSTTEYYNTVCIPKHIYKKTIIFNTLKSKIQPDFIYYRNGDFYIEEKKDGDDFDTSKSKGEISSLQTFLSDFKKQIQEYTNRTYNFYPIICLHNQSDRDKVVNGLNNDAPYFDKSKTDTVMCISGRDLCEMLEIDFDKITAARPNDGVENVNYFVTTVIDVLYDGLKTLNLTSDSITKLKEIVKLI